MSDPIYFSDAKELPAAAELSPVPRAAAASKAQKVLLKVTRRAALAPQTNEPGSQMLPPGCSMSDPAYSIKDPVYFFGK